MAFTRLNNTTLGVKKEATPYTYEAPAATDGLLLRQDLELNLDREFLEDDTISGTLSKSKSVVGMWSDDLGGMIPVYARSGGTGGGSTPECHYLLESLFGTQLDATDNTVKDDTPRSAYSFVLGTHPTDMEVGQLIIVDVTGTGQLELTKITSITESGGPPTDTTTITVWPPLSAAPAIGADVLAGTNFMLSDTSWPPYSVLAQFDGTKYIRYSGCKTSQLEATFEVGQRVPLNFTFMASLPTYSYTAATDFASNLDKTTAYLVCLDVELRAIFAGTAKGTPTTTETILATPDFGVAIGDYILLETSAGVWETKLISNVSGYAGQDTTITHATSSGAVSATDTVYIIRKRCAGVGDSVTLTMEIEQEVVKCMAPTAGKVAIETIGRTVTVDKNPYWEDWQEFLVRDNAILSDLIIYMGDEENHIFTIYLSQIQNMEVAMTMDPLMRNEVSSQATGIRDEIVMAYF